MMEASISTCVNGKSKRLSVASILLNSLRVLQTRTELLSSSAMTRMLPKVAATGAWAAVLLAFGLLRDVTVLDDKPRLPLELTKTLLERVLEVLPNTLDVVDWPTAPAVPPVAEVRPGATPLLPPEA